MKTAVKLGLLFLALSLSWAFAHKDHDGLQATYGVSDDNPAQIELKLNQDYSFSYQDFSVPTKKIAVSGTYQIKKNRILLFSTDEAPAYHDNWKISEDGQTAKSRKGLTFYTLRLK